MNRTFQIILLLVCFGSSSVFAQITEYDLRNSENREGLELVAFDKMGTKVPARINGEHSFTINGLTTPLRFKKGLAPLPVDIENSTFLYLKHREEENNNAKLFFIYRFSQVSAFTIVNIPLAYLLIVPVVLILIGMFFRRLIILMLVVLAVLFYFSYSKGLDLSSFWDGIKEWLMGWL